jgi:hypothetical protein
MGFARRIGTVLIMGAAGIFMVGCYSMAMRESDSLVPDHRSPGTIVLVPFRANRPDLPGQKLVRVPGFETYISSGAIEADGPETVTGLFRQSLINRGYTLIARGIVERNLSSAEIPGEKPEVFVQRLVLQVKSDSVLMGWVFRYRARTGGPWGVQEPASVAFVALLLNGRDGRLLWRGQFDETQRALSEDVLDFFSFARRGGRWVTAKELASDGVNQLLLTFPGVPARRR